MAAFIPVPCFDLIIFGGTGDLSKRKLLPALWHRFLDEQLPPDARIIGVSRSEMSQEAFVAFARDCCEAASKDACDPEKWADFASRLDYIALDIGAKGEHWAALKAKLAEDDRPRIFYFATSPSLYVPGAHALDDAGLINGSTRIVLEKPIGRDLASATEINDGVGAVIPESGIYRIDHYLGKETVQNLLVLRFANSLFEPIWSRNAIDHVQITVAENLGVEGRGDYYDRSGAMRDMVQNHLLQLLCLTAMEPPNSIDADEVRTEKIKVLKALRPIGKGEIASRTVRGQYEAGFIGDKAVPAYEDEISEERRPSKNETFVAIKAEIDNWRWSGVPFYLRTGKRMPSRRSDIVIQFKPAPHSLMGKGAAQPNRLVIRVQPDEAVRLFLQIKEPGPGGLRLKSAPLNLSFADTFTIRYPDAYERLLMDVVRGNLSLFMRRDEVEAAWTWVDAILSAWESEDVPLETYPSGASGPLSSALMMDRDGRAWWEGEGK